MKVVFLTSSRADYSIYYPLLKNMQADKFFDLSVIAFGTHLSKLHGYSIQHIIDDGFKIDQQFETIVLGDTPEAVNYTISLTMSRFSSLWANFKYDIVFALGDRLEMFAAVMSTVPFNLKVAHLHGGETTLGAIDNVYRHSISLASSYHFVSTDLYKKRLINILDTDKCVFNVGALSVENIMDLDLMSPDEFVNKFHIDLTKRTILCTFHPETVGFEKNKYYVQQLMSSISEFPEYQFLITLPNADTMGSYIRNALISYAKDNRHAIALDNLGTRGYLTAMKYCDLVLGNSSSGFVDASVFPKKVINLGDRQKGRILTTNIFNCIIEKKAIVRKIKEVLAIKVPKKSNVYGSGKTSSLIIKHLKKIIQ
jgi:GDP/UDP-N,N'-diacetylbacillosamine 2-epimerase (hydrolysing)